MSARFPNESVAYRAARDRLLKAEIALRQHTEEVAALRRALPRGGEVTENYEFTDLQGQPTPMSALFGDHDTLAIYSYMFAPGDARPCPACTSVMDGMAAFMPQISQRMAFAAVTAAPPDQIKPVIADRGWHDVPFYSAIGTDYQKRYYGEDEKGRTRTFLNVFTRDGPAIRHFWGSELERADVEGHPRHIDTIWPLWGLLDMTPEGRGTFFPAIFDT